jgi:hypothetical protein
MKKLIIILILLLSTGSMAEAQKMKAWVNQKKTQIEYLILQIAAKKVYLEQVKKGYKIAQEGLGIISSFKRGEFNLHDLFFKSLKNVNPAVKGYVRVEETIELQRKILLGYNQTLRQLTTDGAFTDEEVSYFRSVFSKLLNDCKMLLDDLISVVTSGNLEMKDDERLTRIDKLFRTMQGNYSFYRTFSSEIKATAVSRLKEKTDVETSRALHDLNDQ